MRSRVAGRPRDELLRFRQAVELCGEIVFFTNRDGIIAYVNPAFTHFYGYTADEVVGRLTPRILKGGTLGPDVYAEMWRSLLDAQVVRRHFTNAAKDGTLVDVEATVNAIRGDNGDIAGFIAVQRDVTERRQLEEQLRQTQKMEAIGRLAGGIAHDINNLLTPIIGYSELLATDTAGNPQLSTALDEIRKAGHRAARLVRQLVGFSRKQMLTPQVLDLNQVVSELGTMLTHVIGEDIQLNLMAAPELDRVRLDPGQVEQLVMNLAVNGRHAMPQGGLLTISTANTALDEQFVGRHPGMPPGRYVELRVADTGCGMPPDVLARVFEPFFTTKPQGQGTGLGLSTVYDVVKQSGGCVTIESEPGVGTTVTSYFPAVDDPIEASAADATRPSLDGNETILLVEDDVAIREFTRKVLESYGYTALAAQDVAEAIALGTDHAGPIHLLLSDVVMPDLSGPDLAQRLVLRRPTLRVLYMSGFSNYLATHLGVISKQAGFIPKPFTPVALASRVRQVLDSHMAPPERHSKVE